MIKYREEASGIFVLPLYSSHECRSIIRQARESDGWIDAEVGKETEGGEVIGVADTEYRTARVLYVKKQSRISLRFDEKVNTVIKPLVEKLWRFSSTGHAGTQVVHYFTGGHYAEHVDAALDLESRYFTMLCYLNDDFEGGRTSFPGLSYSATPERGKALLFPSKYAHRAEPVTRGEKFILVAWLLGPVPVKWI